MDARQWIDALPPELAVQARLLRALVAAAEADDRWEALELCCSLASGRASTRPLPRTLTLAAVISDIGAERPARSVALKELRAQSGEAPHQRRGASRVRFKGGWEDAAKIHP